MTRLSWPGHDIDNDDDPDIGIWQIKTKSQNEKLNCPENEEFSKYN